MHGIVRGNDDTDSEPHDDLHETGTSSEPSQRVAGARIHDAGASRRISAHLIELDWLREAYRRTRKDGAAGVDGQTASDYERDLEGKLSALLARFKSGTYRAPPVGRSVLIRYADDAVLVFERKEDAERVMAVIGHRFAKYGLALHPDKTRLVEFVAPEAARRRKGDENEPGRFDLLGFTHVWGKSRKGRWVVQRKTAKGRLARAPARGSVVPKESASPGAGAAPSALLEVTRPLRLLRDHRQHAGAGRGLA